MAEAGQEFKGALSAALQSSYPSVLGPHARKRCVPGPFFSAKGLGTRLTLQAQLCVVMVTLPVAVKVDCMDESVHCLADAAKDVRTAYT